MNVTMYPCFTDPDRPAHEQPTAGVRLADDGEVVIEFLEIGSQLTVTMRKDQFREFFGKMQDLRDNLDISEYAEKLKSGEID